MRRRGPIEVLSLGKHRSMGGPRARIWTSAHASGSAYGDDAVLRGLARARPKQCGTPSSASSPESEPEARLIVRIPASSLECRTSLCHHGRTSRRSRSSPLDRLFVDRLECCPGAARAPQPSQRGLSELIACFAASPFDAAMRCAQAAAQGRRADQRRGRPGVAPSLVHPQSLPTLHQILG